MDSTDIEVDPIIHTSIRNFRQSIDKMEHILNNVLNDISLEDLHLKDKLNYDLFLAYMLNTLYWCYLRSEGLDPNKNKVKNELARVRQYMVNAKQAIERHISRPVLDTSVAERFIKHGVKMMDSGKRKLQRDESDSPTPSKQKPSQS